MISTKTITIIVVLVAIAVVIAWDIFAVSNPIPGDTVSEMTFNAAKANPIIPFALGVVCGHLFWGQT